MYTVYMMNMLAYIDPATTAIIWQVAVGLFVAFSLVLAIWWRRISTFVKGLFVSKKRNPAVESDNHVIVYESQTLQELESEIESLNEQEIYDITIKVGEIKPEFEYLMDKYGVEFEEAVTEEEVNEDI